MNESVSQKSPRKRAGNGNETPQIEDRFATGYDFLLINHDIDGDLFTDVLQCVTEKKKNDKVVLLLVTYGGSANVAYRVGRLLPTVLAAKSCAPLVGRRAPSSLPRLPRRIIGQR
jgi:hypothetical protein